MDEFINISHENINSEHLCCIIRTKKSHPGVDAKRVWLSKKLDDGHIFRKLNVKAPVFIEYEPLETSYVPILGDNYIYLYCLWVSGDYKGKGYGKTLLDYCINDAKSKGKSGICMLGSVKQKAWLSDQSFASKYGFKVVDETPSGYQLYALSFDETKPYFISESKKEVIDNMELTVYYNMQCPYVYQTINMIKEYCNINNKKVNLIEINTLELAKNLPCVFNNFAVFYKGQFQTVNLLDEKTLERILNK